MVKYHRSQTEVRAPLVARGSMAKFESIFVSTSRAHQPSLSVTMQRTVSLTSRL